MQIGSYPSHLLQFYWIFFFVENGPEYSTLKDVVDSIGCWFVPEEASSIIKNYFLFAVKFYNSRV